ncbi:hypothetical protein QRY02_17395 [Amycolatopsis sp. DG1A-15b]|nr:hypothetical protein [Amycolatopsis sp. DG1A-15b]WIX92119.1 hypothetical protein QRY02_17395 [Amycolatopsis sp. DG1A-15b]
MRCWARSPRCPGPSGTCWRCWLHPEAGQACPERAATVAELTAMLRAQVAAEPGHPRAVELAVRSAEFATLWARHDVEDTTRGRMRVDHPLFGELNLD